MLGHKNNPLLNIKHACIINRSDHRIARCVAAAELVIRLLLCDGLCAATDGVIASFISRRPDVPRT